MIAHYAVVCVIRHIDPAIIRAARITIDRHVVPYGQVGLTGAHGNVVIRTPYKLAACGHGRAGCGDASRILAGRRHRSPVTLPSHVTKVQSLTESAICERDSPYHRAAGIQDIDRSGGGVGIQHVRNVVRCSCPGYAHLGNRDGGVAAIAARDSRTARVPSRWTKR